MLSCTKQSGMLFFCALVILLGVYSYIDVISYGFVWDDTILIVDSPKLRMGAWWAIISEPFFLIEHYYRPLPLLSFATDVHFKGVDPAWMHQVNLALFLLNAMLLWRIAYVLYPYFRIADSSHLRLLFATISAAVYIVHPGNIESAAWISGRFDLMVTCFMLSCMNASYSALSAPVKLVGMSVFYGMAAFSKEMAVTLPVILVLLHIAVECGDTITWRQRILRVLSKRFTEYCALILAGGVYLVCRYLVLDEMLKSADEGYFGDTVQHILLSSKAFGAYLFSTVLPFAYSSPIHKEYFPVEYDDRFAWVSLFILILATGYAIYSMRRRPLYGALALCFIVALLPVLHIKPVPIGENLIQERFLAFPLIFFSLLVSAASIRLSQANELTLTGRWAFQVLFIAWVVACVLVLRSQIPMWQNNFVFWNWAYSKSPDSVFANTNLAVAYTRQGDFSKAERHALLANNMPGSVGTSSVVLSNVYMRKGEFDKAKAAIERRLNSPVEIRKIYLKELVNQLGVINLRQGNYQKAEEIFLDVLSEDSSYYKSMVNLGSVYYCLDKKELGDIYWEEALTLMPPHSRDRYLEMFSNVRAHGPVCNKRSSE